MCGALAVASPASGALRATLSSTAGSAAPGALPLLARRPAAHRRLIHILSRALRLPRGIQYREMGMGGGQAEVEREGGDRRGRREGEDKGNGRTGVGREGGKWRGRVEEGGKVKRAQRKGESKWEEN